MHELVTLHILSPEQGWRCSINIIILLFKSLVWGRITQALDIQLRIASLIDLHRQSIFNRDQCYLQCTESHQYEFALFSQSFTERRIKQAVSLSKVCHLLCRYHADFSAT